MPATNKKAPNPIDVHAGARVRLARNMIGMSQGKLGEALGITFQQIQKYEKGVNRMGGSRLAMIAATLKKPITFFFEEVLAIEGEPDPMTALFATEAGAALARAFAKITSPAFRRVVVQLASNLAEIDAATVSASGELVIGHKGRAALANATEREIAEGVRRMQKSMSP